MSNKLSTLIKKFPIITQQLTLLNNMGYTEDNLIFDVKARNGLGSIKTKIFNEMESAVAEIKELRSRVRTLAEEKIKLTTSAIDQVELKHFRDLSEIMGRVTKDIGLSAKSESVITPSLLISSLGRHLIDLEYRFSIVSSILYVFKTVRDDQCEPRLADDYLDKIFKRYDVMRSVLKIGVDSIVSPSVSSSEIPTRQHGAPEVKDRVGPIGVVETSTISPSPNVTNLNPPQGKTPQVCDVGRPMIDEVRVPKLAGYSGSIDAISQTDDTTEQEDIRALKEELGVLRLLVPDPQVMNHLRQDLHNKEVQLRDERLEMNDIMRRLKGFHIWVKNHGSREMVTRTDDLLLSIMTSDDEDSDD